MALRLAKCLGRSPESWLTLQMNHDLWKTRRSARLGRVSRLSCGFASLSDPTQPHAGSAPRGSRRSRRW
jgi:plasmid maintenance system antidote protein VapI